MTTLLLHQFWRSSASWRVRWALREKGLPFQVVTVDLAAGAHHAPAFRALSPLGSVPTLVVEDRALSESVAILELLEEMVPERPLYPRDRWVRARVRQIVELVNSGIQPFQTATVRTRHSGDPAQQDAWVRDWNARGAAALERLLEAAAGELGEGRFAVGDALTAADLFIVPQLHHARRFEVDLAPFPRLRAVEAAARATAHGELTRPELQPGAPGVPVP